MDYPVKPDNDRERRASGNDINSAMTERGECQVITVRESSRTMTVYCVVILVRITEQSQNRPAGLGIFLAIGIKQLTFFFADNQVVGNLYACKEINYGDIKNIKNF